MALRSWSKESLSANDRFRLVVVKKSVVVMVVMFRLVCQVSIVI